MKKFILTTTLFLLAISGLWAGYNFQVSQSIKKNSDHQQVLSLQISALTERILVYRELLQKQNEGALIETTFLTLQKHEELISLDENLPESTQYLVQKHIELIEDEKEFFTQATETKKLSTQSLAELVARQTNLLREFQTELESIQSL